VRLAIPVCFRYVRSVASLVREGSEVRGVFGREEEPMIGGGTGAPTVGGGLSVWAEMILAGKFTKKGPDSMNFVNFAGKRLCFQGFGLSGI
jgi:hypothetical protein